MNKSPWRHPLSEHVKKGLNIIQTEILAPNISSGKYLIVLGLIDSESDKQMRGMIVAETNWIFN